MNPGSDEGSLRLITKIISGSCEDATKLIAEIYNPVIDAGLHLAESIKVAEAAKVVENTQRDLNIGLINELAIIFSKLGIDTQQVLSAAGTKWNFLPFSPGLVGGHCISVDPYYLTYCAEKAGYYPEVILAGRRVNDDIVMHIVNETVKLMIASGGIRVDAKILILVFFKKIVQISETRVSLILSILFRHSIWALTFMILVPR